MQIPLNVDWQQILLHWLNLAILTGGLYFLLFKPVKEFMEKREAHYRDMEEQAAGKLEEAERIKDGYKQKLAQADEEIHALRQKAQAAVQQSAEEQLAQAQKQAKHIVALARTQAEHTKEQAMKESQRELRKLAMEAAEKIAFRTEQDPFDQFLNLAEGGGANEVR